MSAESVAADYLIVGGGAMGMAFADVLLNETDATIAIVDRHPQPGGHWNDAYPFVRLHQPSAFYGVNSRHLGSDTRDSVGWNKGLFELATGAEVVAYFDQVMQRDFLPSGRVSFFPMCEYEGEGRIRSLLGDETYEVTAGKAVDATYMNVLVPSIKPPAYEIEPPAVCLPVNALPRQAHRFDRYVIVGAGKTAMDACLFLLKNGADPASITWITPRDSWLLDRANLQPGKEPTDVLPMYLVTQIMIMAEASSYEGMFDALEEAGCLLRIDPSVRPTMYRCATVTKAEVEQLRRIESVVRMGRVSRITATEITLDRGSIPTSAATLHVDCTADGLAARPPRPIFEGDRITLQSVRTCQQVFSAGLLGHVEHAYGSDEEKNALCVPVPHPDTDADFIRTTLANSANQMRWLGDEKLASWLFRSRLDGLTLDPQRMIDAEGREASQAVLLKAFGNLERFLGDYEAALR